MDNINTFSNQEIKQLLVDFDSALTDYQKNESVVTLFEEQVLKTPEAIAVVFENQTLSYKELNARSNQLAHYLKHKGVKAETLVPISIARSFEMIIGILGILKAGGAYVPIDPHYPADRVSYILGDTRAKLVVCSGGLKEDIKKLNLKMVDLTRDISLVIKEPQHNPAIKISPQQLAYVIYTSGSTGKPKGVMIEHRSLTNYLSNSKARYINNEAGNSGSFFHLSYSFDASVISLFTPLISGKNLVIASAGLLDAFTDKNLEKYAPYDFITITPSHLSLLPVSFKNADGKWLTDKLVIGGERLRLSQFEFLNKENIKVEIINEYGPTEATVGCSSYSFYTMEAPEFTQNEVPIGKPILNTQIYILRRNGQLSPAGVSGEMYIGGVGLARGYLNRADLTSDRFIKDPFRNDPGSRLYKTGDMARWMPDGNIAYLGRIDDQVKIRSYRIELGEIESVLNTSGLVKQGVVLAKSDGSGNKKLVGYVIAIATFDKQAVQKYLCSKLPEYMVPVLWIEVEHFPLTPNGKIDKKALPEPKLTDMVAEYVAPRNVTEEALAVIWQKFLHMEQVGIYHNFFELGGNSLLAIRVISAIRKELNLELSIGDLFVYPTIAALIDQLESKNKTISQLLIPIRETGNKIPLYIICGSGGTVFQFMSFVQLLDPQQPVYGLQQPTDSKSLEEFPNTIEGIAGIYITEILKQNPDGPYVLSGHCLGGNIAFEMALQLKNMGKDVAMLIMFDPYAIEEKEIIHPSFNSIIKKTISKISLKLEFEMFLLLKHPKQDLQYKIEKVKSIIGVNNETKPGDMELESFNKVSKVFETAIQGYKMKPYNGDVLIFYAKEHYYFTDRNKGILYKRMYISNDTKNSWKKHARSVEIYEIEGEHSTMFELNHAAELSEILQSYLENINNISTKNNNSHVFC